MRRGQMPEADLANALEALEERAEGLARLVQRFEAVLEVGLTEWLNITDLARAVGARDARVRVEAPNAPAMTTLNRTAGLRILEELVDNALAFSPADGRVTINVRNDDDEGLTVRVIDQGPGIDADAVTRIFEPLEQAEQLHTRVHQGVGIGLSIARMSALAMEGDVVLEDSGPHGSTFLWTLALPR
jgi:signal transduction histidine kinase